MLLKISSSPPHPPLKIISITFQTPPIWFRWISTQPRSFICSFILLILSRRWRQFSLLRQQNWVKFEINERMKSKWVKGKCESRQPYFHHHHYFHFVAVLSFSHFYLQLETWTIIAKLIRKSNWKSLRKGKKILALGKREYKRITDNNGKFVFFRCCYVCYKKKFDWAALIFLTRCVCHLQSFWKVLKVDSNETETPQAPHNITSAKLKSCFKRREFFSCFFPLNGFSRQLRLIPWKEKKMFDRRKLRNEKRDEQEVRKNLLMMTKSVFIQFLWDYFAHHHRHHYCQRD